MPPTVIDLKIAKSPSPDPAPAPATGPVLATARAVITKQSHVDAVLLKELATTPEYRLRHLVLSICQENSEAARMAAEALLVPESEVNYQSAEESTENEWSEEEEEDKEGKGETEEKEGGLDGKETSRRYNASVLIKAPKRYRGKFAICDSCEEYDVSDSHKGDCYYHDGELEPDYDGDFWGELNKHDRKFGIFEEEMQKEHPERYRWDCCNEPGYDMGCKSDRRHIERQSEHGTIKSVGKSSMGEQKSSRIILGKEVDASGPLNLDYTKQQDNRSRITEFVRVADT